MKNTFIFFDVDGTLRDLPTSKIPKSTKTTLEKLRKNGYKLCIATGRTFTEIPAEIFSLIDWDCYIGANGQTIHSKTREVIFRSLIPENLIRACIKIADKTNSALSLLPLDGEPYRVTVTNETLLYAYGAFDLPVPYMKEYEKEDILMLMAFNNAKDYTEFQNLPGACVYRNLNSYVDITVSGVSKYYGIENARKHFDFDEYIAFGDAANDIEMLKNAKLAVAMAGADEHVRAAATHVTSSVLDDGIERACEALKLY